MHGEIMYTHVYIYYTHMFIKVELLNNNLHRIVNISNVKLAPSLYRISTTYHRKNIHSVILIGKLG